MAEETTAEQIATTEADLAALKAQAAAEAWDAELVSSALLSCSGEL